MPETHRYPLAVAGVGITLETAVDLPVTERFAPFLSENVTSGYRIEFRECAALPEPVGKRLYRSECYEVYPDGAGGFARWYFDEMHGFVRFARTVIDLSGKRVRVEYQSAQRELLSAMGNCFSFGAWERLLQQENRLILHAACVDTPCGGLLFSGPSGIGKSTQGKLWERYRGARLINGDRPILYRDGGVWLACGSPYAGSSRCYVNDCCPVRAIVLLRQAPACSIRPLGGLEAFRRVFAGTTANSWDPESVAKSLDLTQALTSEVPIYELACTPDLAAVELLEGELRKEDASWNRKMCEWSRA